VPRSLPTDGRFAPVTAAAVIAFALAGCGGPELRIETLSNKEPAQVFFKPTHDGEGNEIPATAPEKFIGELPTDWEIPPHLLGGRGLARVQFADGATQEARFSILREKDTLIRVSKPVVPRK
jgi:hypothetical protein